MEQYEIDYLNHKKEWKSLLAKLNEFSVPADIPTKKEVKVFLAKLDEFNVLIQESPTPFFDAKLITNYYLAYCVSSS